MDVYRASTQRLTQPSLQGASDFDFVPGPPAYFSAGDASTSSAVVVASPFGSTLPVVTPPSGVPTNGLSIFTVLEPIKGLWECQNRCGMPNINRLPRFLAARPVGRTIFGTLHSADSSSTPCWAEAAPRSQHDTGGSNCQAGLPTWQYLCSPSRGRGIGHACDCDHPFHNTQWQHCPRTRESISD